MPPNAARFTATPLTMASTAKRLTRSAWRSKVSAPTTTPATSPSAGEPVAWATATVPSALDSRAPSRAMVAIPLRSHQTPPSAAPRYGTVARTVCTRKLAALMQASRRARSFAGRAAGVGGDHDDDHRLEHRRQVHGNARVHRQAALVERGEEQRREHHSQRPPATEQRHREPAEASAGAEPLLEVPLVTEHCARRREAGERTAEHQRLTASPADGDPLRRARLGVLADQPDLPGEPPAPREEGAGDRHADGQRKARLAAVPPSTDSPGRPRAAASAHPGRRRGDASSRERETARQQIGHHDVGDPVHQQRGDHLVGPEARAQERRDERPGRAGEQPRRRGGRGWRSGQASPPPGARRRVPRRGWRPPPAPRRRC